MLTDRTDCTDSVTHTTCFSTTEMTDLTDFVSIACSLRYWPVTYQYVSTDYVVRDQVTATS